MRFGDNMWWKGEKKKMREKKIFICYALENA